MACVQVVTGWPMSSNPVLQVYVAVSPTEFPVDVTSPLPMLVVLVQSAEKKRNNLNSRYINRATWHLLAKITHKIKYP